MYSWHWICGLRADWTSRTPPRLCPSVRYCCGLRVGTDERREVRLPSVDHRSVRRFDVWRRAARVRSGHRSLYRTRSAAAAAGAAAMLCRPATSERKYNKGEELRRVVDADRYRCLSHYYVDSLNGRKPWLPPGTRPVSVKRRSSITLSGHRTQLLVLVTPVWRRRRNET